MLYVSETVPTTIIPALQVELKWKFSDKNIP